MNALLRIPRAARNALHGAAAFTGMNRVVAGSTWRRSRLLVLCYHGVSIGDEHLWSDLYVSPEHLERRLALLRKLGATVMPFGESLQRLAANDLPECAVALTFDDGAYDFSARARPVLAAAGAHSTLYLTTWYCGKNYPVFDTMASYLMWKGRGRVIHIPGLELSVQIPSSVDASFQALHEKLRAYAKSPGMSEEDRQQLLVRLAAIVGVDFPKLLDQRLLQLMTPAEVAALDPSAVDIELHSHRHRTPRNHDLFVREIRDNQERIDAYSGRTELRRHFCYPSGDYIPEYREWLREVGVQSATTCDPGLGTRFSDPYFFPRFIDTMGETAATFSAWVSGVASFTARGGLTSNFSRTIPASSARTTQR